jgi:D-amino-acid dehydrogenase
MSTEKIAVIGAGIIGVTCAYEIRRHGFDVVLIDPQDNETAPSLKNAGALAYSEILPIASGSVLWKVPKWLADPRGPLSIRVGYLPRLAPWLMRFVLASSEQRVQATAVALAALNLLSRDLCGPLYEAAEISKSINRTGAFHLYESKSEHSRAMPGWQIKERNGIRFRHIDAEELRALEPALSHNFHGATLIDDWHLVSDPRKILDALFRLGQDSGVGFVAESVSAIDADENGAELSFSGGSPPMRVNKALIAAGAWSGTLARRLGDSIPVEAERGYNTTVVDPGIRVNAELIFGEHGFVATPLECGLRIGGAAEFAGLDGVPRYQRADTMLNKASRFLPGLQTESATRWMGCRPSMPDSRPVIGAAVNAPNVLYAFGHGHTGLTQAPGTARLVVDMLLGEQSSIDTEPFSAKRFHPYFSPGG